MAVASRTQEEGLPVVGEFEFRPSLDQILRFYPPALLYNVDGGEWGLFEVSRVVEEDRASARGGDGKDGAGRIVGGKIWRM